MMMTAATWATTVAHGAAAAHSVSNPPELRGDAAHLQFHEKSRYRAAAFHARRVYPGALGELIDRELRGYADFGYQLADDGLPARLAAQILAMPARPRPSDHGPGPSRGCSHDRR